MRASEHNVTFAMLGIFKIDAAPDQDVDVRVSQEDLPDPEEEVLGIKVIHIEKRDDLTGRAPKTSIHGVVSAGVWLADHGNLRIVCKDLQRAIGRAGVDDNMLEAGIILALHALDCLHGEA